MTIYVPIPNTGLDLDPKLNKCLIIAICFSLHSTGHVWILVESCQSLFCDCPLFTQMAS